MEQQDKDQVQQMIQDAIARAMDFSTRKLGDTPTDANQLTPKKYTDTKVDKMTVAAKGDLLVGSAPSVISILSVGSDGQVLTASSSATLGVQWASVSGLSNVSFFGDGSDGAANADGSTAVTGATRSGSVYTLNRDVYYTDLTVSTANTNFITNGYQIFASGTVTVNLASTTWIGWNGVAGGPGGNGGNDASPGAGGGGGSVLVGVTVPGALGGVTGGAGGSGNVFANGVAGVSGNAGASSVHSIGTLTGVNGPKSLGNGGAAGGFSGGAAGGSVLGGTSSVATSLPDSINGCYIHADLGLTYQPHSTSAGSGAGAGGGGGAGDTFTGSNGGGGGGGGGSGGNGGTVVIYAKNIIINAVGGIRALGGDGGAGGNGGDARDNAPGHGQGGGGGGGSGGSGGSGGVIILVYKTLTLGPSASLYVTGGNGGAAGTGGNRVNGGAVGDPGTNSGNTGATGKIYQFQILT